MIEALNRPTAVVEAGGMVWVVSSGDSTVYRFNPPTFRVGPLGGTDVGRRSTAHRVRLRCSLGHEQRRRHRDAD